MKVVRQDVPVSVVFVVAAAHAPAVVAVAHVAPELPVAVAVAHVAVAAFSPEPVLYEPAAAVAELPRVAAVVVPADAPALQRVHHVVAVALVAPDVQLALVGPDAQLLLH